MTFGTIHIVIRLRIGYFVTVGESRDDKDGVRYYCIIPNDGMTICKVQGKTIGNVISWVYNSNRSHGAA